ncbi:MAG: glycoside hydrolase family 9 protein [Oscillospiraceae bacterium]|nr:glycoside hydrolase family 9 protein [Oscillospiraceae bacterium]
MNKQLSKRITAAVMSAAVTASAAVSMLPALTVSAAHGEICGESTFDYKMLPWHTVENMPARQEFQLEDGTVHIRIITARGWDGEAWDLQFRHRKLDFKAGHTYKVSFSAKASRDGLKINSHIGDTGEPYHEYCCLKKEGFVQGPHMDGGGQGWGEPVTLTTEWQTFEGTFECTEDLKAKEWVFHYADGEKGNAKDGDEIWFDNMSIIDQESGCTINPMEMEYGGVSRYWSRLENNFISVNQLGYFTKGAKTAVLGDNQSNPSHLPWSESIRLNKDSYTFELVSASSGEAVYTGTTGKKFYDENSQENVCRIDFSEYTTPGTYYLRIKDTEWRSFEFQIADNPYQDDTNDMLTNALNYFYQNRSGMDIEAKYITSGETGTLAHRGGHKQDLAYIQTEWRDIYMDKQEAPQTYASSKADVTGGWYNAADHTKSMIEGGMAVWTLQNMYERSLKHAGRSVFKDGSGTCVVPETGNAAPDILDECRYELDFMEKMKVDASERTWGELAGLYYHQVQDSKWTGLAVRPWDYQEEWETERIIKPPTFAATLNYAACAAQATRLWQEYDAAYAKKLMINAAEAYQAFKQHYYTADLFPAVHPIYKTDCPREEINEKSQYAPKLQNYITNGYGDCDVSDDAYWAACELYLSAKAMGTAGAENYLKDLSAYQEAFKMPTRITGGENEDDGGSFTLFNWGNTGAAGSLSLALHTDVLTAEQKKTLDKAILAAADEYIAAEEEQGYGIPYKGRKSDPYIMPSGPEILPPDGFEYGSNARAVSNMIAMAYAYDLTGNAKYYNGITTGMGYLFGCNPLSFSYISGYGKYKVRNPEHRYWGYELDDTFPMAPDGVLVAGPTVDLRDPYLRGLGFDMDNEEDNPSEKCFVDSIEAFSCNAVSLSWNAELAWIVYYLQEWYCPGPPQETEPGTIITAPQETVWGDADGNGNTDVSDAVLLARYLTEDAEAIITDQGRMQANVISGPLDSADLTALLMIIAKKIRFDQFPLDKLPVG